MSAAEDVARHIHGSLLDLRRRVDGDVAIAVARAVVEGASRALEDLIDDGEPAPGALAVPGPVSPRPTRSAKH